MSIALSIRNEDCNAAHPRAGGHDVDKGGCRSHQRKPVKGPVQTEQAIQRKISHAGNKYPRKLDHEREQNEPYISAPEGPQDAFDFPEAQIDKSSGQEEDEDEDEFPHTGRIIHKRPRVFRGCLCKILFPCHSERVVPWRHERRVSARIGEIASSGRLDYGTEEHYSSTQPAL